MKFEHFGMNVPDARAMANWYIDNCDMSAVISMDTEPYAHFLADKTGRVVIEIYSNQAKPMPDYHSEDPSRLHFAFAVDDAGETKERLSNAGATVLTDDKLDDGSHLVMMRDPWGLSLQLCSRANPM